MSLPDKFIMRDTGCSWEMEKQSDGLYSCVIVKTKYGGIGTLFGPYTESQVERMIFDGKYTIEEVVSPCNGQDADGNPLNYTVDNLQLFQRVVLKNGDEAIVAPGFHGSRVDLVYGNSTWVEASFSDGSYSIAEVYGMPNSTWKMLDPKEKGKLLWKYVEKVVETKEQAAFKQRQEYFSTQISVVEDKLTSLQQEIEALKAFV